LVCMRKDRIVGFALIVHKAGLGVVGRIAPWLELENVWKSVKKKFYLGRVDVESFEVR
jgi:hypothetical protein